MCGGARGARGYAFNWVQDLSAKLFYEGFTSVLISACLLTGLVGCSNSDDGMKVTEDNQIMETIEVVEMETIEVVEAIPSFPEDCQSQDVIDAMEARISTRPLKKR